MPEPELIASGLKLAYSLLMAVRSYLVVICFTFRLAILSGGSIALAAPSQTLPGDENAPLFFPARFWIAQKRHEEIERSRELLAAGHLDEAILILKETVRIEPDNPDAFLVLGTAFALVPQRSQASEALRKAIELRPDFAPAYVTLGMTLARFVEMESAEEALNKALSLDPGIVDAHISLGLLLAQRKQLASARQHFQAALKLTLHTPAAAYPHYLLAQVLAEERQFAQALSEIEAAIRLHPNYGGAYLSQGLIKKRLLDDDGALQAFRKAMELSPNDDPKVRYELGAAYLKAGEALPAIEHLQKSLELKPGDRFPIYHLCRALRRAGKTDEAKACQQRLSEIIHGQLKAADLMVEELNNDGVKLEQAGDLAGALEKYREAVNLDPVQTVFRRNLALVLCRLGRWDEGIAELKEVLEIDPADIKATKALYLALEKTGSGQKPVKEGKAKPKKPRATVPKH
jgi:tetratricopeptide (TPR) repeat protein